MKILPFEDGPVATIGYLVIDTETKRAMLVDCPLGSTKKILAALAAQGATLDAIVITHGHWDHTGDAPLLAAATKSPVAIHGADAHWLENPMGHFEYLGMEVPGMAPDRLLADGDVIECGGLRFTAIHVPGHSQGSVALYEAAEGVLFSGDILFEGSIGRTDLHGGDFDALIAGIRAKLLTLPDATRVYPGHGSATTIGRERAGNPYLR